MECFRYGAISAEHILIEHDMSCLFILRAMGHGKLFSENALYVRSPQLPLVTLYSFRNVFSYFMRC